MVSPIDGRDRIGASQRLSNFPIAVAATSTIDSALADWRRQTALLVAVAAFTALVITSVLIVIGKQMSRQQDGARRRLALEKQRLDTAVNNMSQGLVLFDASQRVLACNQRYLDMFRLSPEEIGPGTTLRELLTYRKQLGWFSGDVDRTCETFPAQVARGKVSQTQHELPDGRSVSILHRAIPDGGWVTTIEDITERARYEEKIAHLAHYDPLTDLCNRALFHKRLQQAFDKAGRPDADADARQFALLYIDIDKFKSINDSLGHHVGDELLKTIASRLRDCVGDDGFVARLGGDEFAILQTNIRSRTVGDLVSYVHEALRQPCDCLGHRVSTDASIGIALAPEHGGDCDQIIRNADIAMYAAKTGGRHAHRFFVPLMDADATARQGLEQDLRLIVDDHSFVEGGFELHYQPVVDLRTNAITACEALLRWRHPKRGLIGPSEFIPIAEETGLITALGEWVLATACVEAARWPRDIGIAVNVSPAQFKSETLGLHVASALATSNLNPRRLELEITEAVLILDDDPATATLRQLRALGCRIALDDFGTGYSSLSYLRTAGSRSIRSRSIARSCRHSTIPMVRLRSSRRWSTSRRPVTWRLQSRASRPNASADMLRALGCSEVQGFLFSAARPAYEARVLLAAGHTADHAPPIDLDARSAVS